MKQDLEKEYKRRVKFSEVMPFLPAKETGIDIDHYLDFNGSLLAIEYKHVNERRMSNGQKRAYMELVKKGVFVMFIAYRGEKESDRNFKALDFYEPDSGLIPLRITGDRDYVYQEFQNIVMYIRGIGKWWESDAPIL